MLLTTKESIRVAANNNMQIRLLVLVVGLPPVKFSEISQGR